MDYTFFKATTSNGKCYLRLLKNQGYTKDLESKFYIATKNISLLRSSSLNTIFYINGELEVGDMSKKITEIHQEIHRYSSKESPTYVTRCLNAFLTSAGNEEDVKEAEEQKERVTTLSKLRSKYEVPNINDGFFVNDDDWYLIIRNIKNSINTLMTGACGTGKSSLVMLACEKMGIECNIYDMGAMHDPVSGLLGVHRLQGSESIFDYAKFTQDIQKEGVILLDELSRAPSMAANILFPCLDHRRRLQIDMAGSTDTRSIDVHPKCCFMATANIGNEYTGTLSLDRALVDRFFPVELSVLSEDAEKIILSKRTGVVASQSRMIVNIANRIRRKYAQQELSNTVSTRETLMVGELVSDGWDLIRAMEMVFYPMFEGTKTDGERSIICKMFTTL